MGVGRRRGCLSLLLVAGVLAMATPAWAHGQVRPGRTAAGSTVATVLVVPSERNGHSSSHIALALPPGFIAKSCGSPTGWRCSTADTGFSWQRVTGQVTAERFDFTMQVAGTAGTYVLPMSQTYDDGQRRTFAGAPGTRDAAPLFTVTSQSGASTSPVPSASPAPSGTAAPDGALGSLPPGRRLDPPSSDGTPIALVAVGFVALTVLGGALLFVRQRQAAPPEQS